MTEWCSKGTATVEAAVGTKDSIHVLGCCLQEGYNSKLLFKKRMFRETDETITEPQFVNLSYVQVWGQLG